MTEREWKRTDDLRAMGAPAEAYNDNLLGEISSPTDLGASMIEILQPKSHEKIYDGAFGRLGFLLSAKDYIENREGKKVDGKNFFGREINERTFKKYTKLAEEKGLRGGHFYNENTLGSNGKEANKYDVILSHPPFGLRVESGEGELGILTNDGANKFLQHYINSLKPNGRAALVVANAFLFSQSKSAVRARKHLLENCSLHTVLELPSKTFLNTGTGASVLFFEKGGKTTKIKYYLKSLEEDYSAFLSFVKGDAPNDRSFVYSIENNHNENLSLPTATNLAIKKEVEEKTKNFEDFRRYKLEEVCLEVNLTKEKFQEKPNAVYLPKLGKSAPATCIQDTTIKHQNLFQIVLKDEIISNGYMAYFLRSSLGQMILESCFTGNTIPSISKGALMDKLEVYAPSLEEQGLIAQTFTVLAEVKSLMERTAIELSSNPRSAKHILEKLFETKKAFNELSTEDKILKFISGGETKKVEFKQTLSMDMKTEKKEKHIELAVLKTIAAFLNTEGGCLFVGVHDDGQIIGTESEVSKFFQSKDKYLRHLKSLIKDKIGEEFYPFVDYSLVRVSGKEIIFVECRRSNKPCYLDKNDFYVRTNPATDKLEGPKLVEYVRTHFDK